MMPDVVAMCVDLERVPVKDSGFFADCNGPDEANNISQTAHNAGTPSLNRLAETYKVSLR